MFHMLSKKSKGKPRQKSQLGETITFDMNKMKVNRFEMKSATPDVSHQRKFYNHNNPIQTLKDEMRLGGSMRTRSTSSRRSFSTMVAFESVKPTQVWQASPTPSPPTGTVTDPKSPHPKNTVDNLTLSILARVTNENQWLSLSTEDDLSDSSEEEIVSGKKVLTSIPKDSTNSPSSTDSSSSYELPHPSTKTAVQRRIKTSSKRPTQGKEGHSAVLAFSGSSHSSSSSEDESEFDLCRKGNNIRNIGDKTNIPSTPQPKYKSFHHNNQQSASITQASTPQVMPRYSQAFRFQRPQTHNIAATAFSLPVLARNSSKETPYVQTLARVIDDFLPNLDWIEKYKIICVNRGDILRILPHPGTNPDNSPTPDWFLAQKWCTDHGSGTGPIGFVPRVVCSFIRLDDIQQLSLVSSRHPVSQDYSLKTSEVPVFMTTSHELQTNTSSEKNITPTICDTMPDSAHKNQIFITPEFPFSTPIVTRIKNSYSSIPAIYETEDRDSGRGPSSGSEWSSGKGGSLSGATDVNSDYKDHVQNHPASNAVQHSRQKWLPTSQQRQTFSSPLPPPPMALLSRVCTEVREDKKSISTMSDPECGGSNCSVSRATNRLYVRGSSKSPVRKSQEKAEKGSIESSLFSEDFVEDDGDNGSPPTVVVSSNSDPSQWEPYKTMIQVGQNKLQKFTLV